MLILNTYQLTFLGTGTSQGVPVIGSSDPVSLSCDPRDKRLRASVLVETPSKKSILIDCGPDFRMQMLNNQKSFVDAILLTHEHNDHIIGLDDVRPIVHQSGKNMPIFAQNRVCEQVKQRFSYAFSQEPYPGAPAFDLHPIHDVFFVENEAITPIHVVHGKLPILGFKIGHMAYITDASHLPEAEFSKLENLHILVLNCLRKTPAHPSHLVLDQALELVERLRPKRTFFTHISAAFGFHREVNLALPNGVELAYDGLSLAF